MKKIIPLICLGLIWVLAACSTSEAPSTDSDAATDSTGTSISITNNTQDTGETPEATSAHPNTDSPLHRETTSSPVPVKPTETVETLDPTATVGVTEAAEPSETTSLTETIDGYFITVRSNLPGAVKLTGGNAEQIIQSAEDFKSIRITAQIGYKYLYYEINGARYTSTTVTLPEITEHTEVLICSEYATYELPIVNIHTNGQVIESKTDYVDMTFDLSNTDSPLTTVTGGIRLRGKSTAEFDKKPFRVKFDEKQSLFGLEEAKSWVLLAEYLDPSCLHNYTALSLGAEADGLAFTPSPHHVNVYLNGEFMGLYTLCEQIQENKGRIDIEKPITEEMTKLKDFNYYICMNEYAPEEPGAVEGETYFYIPECDRYFELKYPQKSDFTSEEQFADFFEQLEKYYGALVSKFQNGDAQWITQNVNVDSLIDYMIIDQIMGERDHIWKSFNMFYTTTSDDSNVNGRLNFGPIWDYDYSLYVPWTGEPNEYYYVGNELEFSNIFFKGLADSDVLYGKLMERYSEHFSGVLEQYIDHLHSYEETIKESLALNQQRWYSKKPGLTKNNITFLYDFLENRLFLLDTVWG